MRKFAALPPLVKVVVVALSLAAGWYVYSLTSSSGTPAKSGPHAVVYKVTGSASQADLTFATASGGTSQQSGVDVPLTRKSGGEGLTLSVGSGAFLYISAQNPNDDGGTLTCSIEVDGVEVTTNTSRGSFTIVTCSSRT